MTPVRAGDTRQAHALTMERADLHPVADDYATVLTTNTQARVAADR